jgi:hypothetical protein
VVAAATAAGLAPVVPGERDARGWPVEEVADGAAPKMLLLVLVLPAPLLAGVKGRGDTVRGAQPPEPAGPAAAAPLVLPELLLVVLAGAARGDSRCAARSRAVAAAGGGAVTGPRGGCAACGGGGEEVGAASAARGPATTLGSAAEGKRSQRGHSGSSLPTDRRRSSVLGLDAPLAAAEPHVRIPAAHVATHPPPPRPPAPAAIPPAPPARPPLPRCRRLPRCRPGRAAPPRPPRRRGAGPPPRPRSARPRARPPSWPQPKDGDGGQENEKQGCFAAQS